MAKKSSGSTKITLFWIVGFCAFVALMCSGFSWLLSVCGVTAGFLGKLEMIANIILTVIAVACGWIWLSSTKMNKTLKIVLEVFFIVFAILAICGYCGVHF